MTTIAHQLMIYNTDTGKLILSIRLTALQVMALRPLIHGAHIDDPQLTLRYRVKDCELFLASTTDP
jgi:hypothetical protein